jgi:hypothetical protein
MKRGKGIAPETIKVPPRRALFEVRKSLPGPIKVEPSGRYRRTRERRATREIVADEAGGC